MQLSSAGSAPPLQVDPEQVLVCHLCNLALCSSCLANQASGASSPLNTGVTESSSSLGEQAALEAAHQARDALEASFSKANTQANEQHKRQCQIAADATVQVGMCMDYEDPSGLGHLLGRQMSVWLFDKSSLNHPSPNSSCQTLL